MAQVQIINGGWQDAEGNPLAGGTIEFQLSANAFGTNTLGSAMGYLICAGQKVTFALDDNGNVVADAYVWSNDSLLSAVTGNPDTFYFVTAFADTGQRVWGPNAVYILGSPCNLSLLVPSNPA
jgi:hypothetical protein